MKRETWFVVGVTLAVWGLWFPSVFAAGSFIPGNGARASGKAGAVVATGKDSDAVLYNPANLGRLRGLGLRFDVSFSFQEAAFRRAPEGGVTFDRVEKAPNPVFIPMLSIWYTFKNLGPGNLTLAAFGYGPHGRSGFKFPEKPGECKKSEKGDAQVCNPMPEPGPQRLNMIATSSPLILSGVAAAYEWKPTSDWGIRLGGTFKIAYLSANQRQGAIAASLFYQSASKEITAGEVIMDLSGTGFAFTGDVGLSVTTPVGLSFGLSFLFPYTANVNGELNVQISELFDSLASIQGNQVEASLNFPLIVRAGLGWENRVFSFEVALVAELWSVAQEIAIRPQEIKLRFGDTTIDIPDFAIAQNLRDSLSVRVGMEYELTRWVLLRFGWLMETGATPVQNLSTSTIDYPKHAISGGVSVRIPGGLQFDVSIMHSFAREFTVTNSPLRPIDVSPDNLANPEVVKSVANGDYRYAVTFLSFGIRGNWLK